MPKILCVFLYNAFQSARHPKMPVDVAASTSPRNTCSLDPTNSAFQTAHDRMFLYFTMCVKVRLTRDEKINHCD